MTMSKHITDRERDKFVEDANGNTAVRTLSGISDDEGDELKITADGSINVESISMKALLCQILNELKILNIHQSLASDHEISNREII